MASKTFFVAELVQGARKVCVLKSLVDVVFAAEVEHFDIRRADVAATAVVDLEVPANSCPVRVGGLWLLKVRDGVDRMQLDLLAARLVDIMPGPSRWRKVYRWQFLVVRRPEPDPFNLFPRPRDVHAEGVDILADLATFLRSEYADAVVARFNAEGGFVTPASS
jgi:hypothetical protein